MLLVVSPDTAWVGRKLLESGNFMDLVTDIKSKMRLDVGRSMQVTVFLQQTQDGDCDGIPFFGPDCFFDQSR